MIRIPSLKQLPTIRGRVLVTGPAEHDESGVTYHAWSPADGGWVRLWVDAVRIDDDPSRAERLARQGLATTIVQHPSLGETRRIAEVAGRVAIIERALPGQPDDSETTTEIQAVPGPKALRNAIANALQAARALQILHQAGIIHGHPAIDRILAQTDGHVVLTGSSRVPPPSTDSQQVEPPTFPDPDAARNDLKILGLAIYAWVTGRDLDPTNPMQPHDVNPRVASELNQLIIKMIGDPRLPSLKIDEVVTTLERIAGVPDPTTFLPQQAWVNDLQNAATSFAKPPTLILQRRVLLGVYGGTGAFGLLCLLLGLNSLGFGLLYLISVAALAQFVIGGICRGGSLFDRVVQLVVGGRPRDLATAGLVLVTGLVGLWWTELLGLVILLTIVGIGGGIAFEIFLNRPLMEERAPALNQARQQLRDLRKYGLPEARVFEITAKHAGPSGSPLLRALFDPDRIRSLGDRALTAIVERKLQGRLERWLIGLLDRPLRVRQQRRDRQLLEFLEEKRLEAGGLNLLTARRRSKRIAGALLARLQEATENNAHGERVPENVMERLEHALRDPEAILSEAETPQPSGIVVRQLRDWCVAWLDAATSPRVRFLLGFLLLIGSLAWARQNQIISTTEVRELTEAVQNVDSFNDLGNALEEPGQRLRERTTTAAPLQVQEGPPFLSRIFQDLNAPVAALILLGSAFVHGRLVALLTLGAAVVALFGAEFGIPAIGPLDARSTSLIAALGIAALSLVRLPTR